MSPTPFDFSKKRGTVPPWRFLASLDVLMQGYLLVWKPDEFALPAALHFPSKTIADAKRKTAFAYPKRQALWRTPQGRRKEYWFDACLPDIAQNQLEKWADVIPLDRFASLRTLCGILLDPAGDGTPPACPANQDALTTLIAAAHKDYQRLAAAGMYYDKYLILNGERADINHGRIKNGLVSPIFFGHSLTTEEERTAKIWIAWNQESSEETNEDAAHNMAALRKAFSEWPDIASEIENFLEHRPAQVGLAWTGKATRIIKTMCDKNAGTLAVISAFAREFHEIPPDCRKKRLRSFYRAVLSLKDSLHKLGEYDAAHFPCGAYLKPASAVKSRNIGG